jgi:hypothetical protein
MKRKPRPAPLLDLRRPAPAPVPVPAPVLPVSVSESEQVGLLWLPEKQDKYIYKSEMPGKREDGILWFE